ncbi:NAD(P)/FAD-dependent oxidoreductase [Microbulbifer sp. S227A]|uniref:NAD(P)/FAD-dependent oxidoreductase n=1 Tax=Microbulbifer sp. S227A TaxID=3415131 RepID=UPI003C7D71BE
MSNSIGSDFGTVIIGAGQSALTAAEQLRRRDYGAPITIIGEEAVAPYQRPPLSKTYLLGDVPLNRIVLKPESWYEDNRIALIKNTRAMKVDRETASVSLSDGRTISYGNLIFATGAKPRRLPGAVGGGLKGVFTIRGIEDIDAIRPYLKSGNRLLVVGGGFIGLEMAAVARKIGLSVVLIEAQNRILARVAGAQTANWIADLHASRGVEIRTGIGLERLEREQGVISARLTDGHVLNVECAVVGIGAEPACDLARDAGLPCDNGISVNSMGQTCDRRIWAVGDCARYHLDTGPVRFESVGNAIDTANIVAANISGTETRYVPRPWFWSDQYDFKLQMAGHSTADCDVLVRDVKEEGRSHWYFRGNTFVAVDALNAPRAYMIGRRLLEAANSPSRQEIANPHVHLRNLL